MMIAFSGTACAEPTAENGYTSFIVKTGKTTILVDTSSNPVQFLLKMDLDPGDLDVVVLTHFHSDHISGFPSLIQSLSCLKREKELLVLSDLYTRKKARSLNHLLEVSADDLGFYLTYLNKYECDNISITLIPGHHSVPTSMIKLKDRETSLFYTSDTIASTAVVENAKDANILIHEATGSHIYLPILEKDYHSSALHAGEAADKAKVDTLILCHFC